jgi:hypothetical protein
MKPGSMTLVEQMNTYRRADSVVFSEGSACHGVELLGSKSLGNVHLIERRVNHREIFRRVLEPRSKYYSVFEGTTPLGTVVLGQDRETALEHLGVSILECGAFLDHFQEITGANISAFSKDLYFQSAFEDFDRYVEFHRRQGSTMVDSTEIGKMRSNIRRHQLAASSDWRPTL